MVLYIIGLGLGDEKDITVRYAVVATDGRGAVGGGRRPLTWRRLATTSDAMHDGNHHSAVLGDAGSTRATSLGLTSTPRSYHDMQGLGGGALLRGGVPGDVHVPADKHPHLDAGSVLWQTHHRGR